jgi:hypothetical protein
MKVTIATLSTVLILLQCFQWGESTRELLLTPQNIEYYATFLHPGVDIQPTVIHFGPRGDIVTLLEVPIGQIDQHATVVITLGQNKTHVNTPGVDSDWRVGISDGTNINVFLVVDANNYPNYSPCFPVSGTHDGETVPAGTLASATLKFTFTPYSKFAFCETAQKGGFINTGVFDSQIDITKPLFLIVTGDETLGSYYYHYFKVEIF